MIKRIVFLGGPSTGKTTLSEALAKKFDSLSVVEYGRDYWLAHQVNRRLTPEQLLHIAQTQNQMEDNTAIKAKDFLFCDTNAFTTWHFAIHYHQKALPELERLAQQCWQRYDLVVLCEDDIPYDDTWERSGDANRQEFQEFIREYLAKHQIPHITASGSLEQRINTVLPALATETSSNLTSACI